MLLKHLPPIRTSLPSGNPLPDLQERMDDLKNTSGAKFFDPAQQSVFPERDFHLCLRADTVPFILRLKKEGDLGVMERVDVL